MRGMNEALPDSELTSEQCRLIDALGASDVEAIDMALLAASSKNWRKVAFVVALALQSLADRFPGVPDVYFSQRVHALVSLGKLDSQGNSLCMRFSEVRLSVS
jgi:hypothetical protein